MTTAPAEGVLAGAVRVLSWVKTGRLWNSEVSKFVTPDTSGRDVLSCQP